MCLQDAVFLRDSLESVVSIERLLEKRSFSTASKGLPPNDGRPFLILPAYLPVFSHSFCMITATCARVAVPCGSKRLPDLPLSRPAFCILVTASFA